MTSPTSSLKFENQQELEEEEEAEDQHDIPPYGSPFLICSEQPSLQM